MKIVCKTRFGNHGEVVMYSVDSDYMSVLFDNDSYTTAVLKDDVVSMEVVDV